MRVVCRLTKKAEPPPTRDVNRDSGTASANGGSGDFHEKAVKVNFVGT